MGKAKWEQEAMADADLLAVGVSPKRGRGLQVAFGVLAIGAVTFGIAYYVPLHRAHATLTEEFTTLSQQAAEDRKQLTTAADALKKVTAERDQLLAFKTAKSTERAKLDQDLGQLEREVGSKLKAFVSKRWVSVSKQEDGVRVAVSSKSLFNRDGTELNRSGEKLLCQALEPLKVFKGARVVIRGHGSDADAKRAKDLDSGWELAAARAGSGANVGAEDCGFSASALTAAAAASSKDEAPLTIELLLESPGS